MKTKWLNKDDSEQLILFFNGWGMDARVVEHLEKSGNILMIWDYRDLEVAGMNDDLKKYGNIAVVAWSMGVWAASRVIPLAGIRVDYSVALNGTERPVDDRYGIPVKIYELTEKGMDEKGRDKFFSRMLEGKEEKERFAAHLPSRDISEQREELGAIRRHGICLNKNMHWDKIIVSEKDLIFPVENQLNWWKERQIPVERLGGGHYPFYHFKSWTELIGYDR